MIPIIESRTPAWLFDLGALKKSVLAHYSEMPEVLREKKPSKAAWSASEVVEHLIIVEEQVAGSWRKEIGSGSPVPLGLKSHLLTTMVSAVMAHTHVRVPTVPELVPSGGLALPELTSRWEKARKELTNALPEYSKVAWTMHPVFGPLSSDQMGKIMVSHLKHHLRHWPEVSQN
jgi:hypothetical protein